LHRDVGGGNTDDTRGAAEDCIARTDTTEGGTIRIRRISDDREALDVREVIATQEDLIRVGRSLYNV
jgi:hypothetical protein